MFTVQKLAGRWRFVEPTHAPKGMFLRAPYAIMPETRPEGILYEKYGRDDRQQYRWREAQWARLQEWGFNCVGAYAHGKMRCDVRPKAHMPGNASPPPDADSLPDTSPGTAIPYIHITKPSAYAGRNGFLNLCSAYEPDRSGDLYDFFDPRWPEYVRDFVRSTDEMLAWGNTGNPLMLGIMMDDADQLRGFGPGPDVPAPRLHVHPADYARANPGSHAHGELLRAGDDDAFLYLFARRYFSTFAAALRERSPGHLLFSPNLNSWGGLTRPPILRAAVEHCDVIQVGISSREQLALTLKHTGDKPLVTWDGFTANEDSPYRGKVGAGAGLGLHAPVASTQEERGELYVEKMRLLLESPNVAGMHLWAWLDHPGEETNWGLVTQRDNAYDGIEATRGGGEAHDYGDYLNAVVAGNYLAEGTSPLPGPDPDPVPEPEPVEPPAAVGNKVKLDDWYEIEVEVPGADSGASVTLKGRARLSRKAR